MLKRIEISILLIFIGFGSGWVVAQKFFKESPEIIYKTKIKTKVIYRNYEKLPKNKLIEKLKCYDLGVPELDGRINDNVFIVNAGLCERKWRRDFHIGTVGNWKLYATIGGIGIIVGGYLTYKLIR